MNMTIQFNYSERTRKENYIKCVMSEHAKEQSLRRHRRSFLSSLSDIIPIHYQKT